MGRFYEFYMDTFKYSYTGYFSSIEKAIEMIPDCPRFKESLSWRSPGLQNDESKNWEHNRNIRAQLSLKDSGHLEVVVPDYRVTKYFYEKIPEVKEVGKPYQPATRNKINEESREFDASHGLIEIRELKIDELQESY